MQTNDNTDNSNTLLEAIDKLNEIHNQTQALTTVLMAYLHAADDGGDVLSDRVLSSYVWQIQSNIDRAESAASVIAKRALA
jgi:hypothetical protein